MAGSTSLPESSLQPSPSPAVPNYGAPISLDAAKRAVAAAEAEALANQWSVTIAVVDSGGHLVVLHRMDQTHLASLSVAQTKAETAVYFRRPTRIFEETVAAGGLGLRLLSMPGHCAIEGGVPLLVNGEIVGAIGVSGVQSVQDAQVARAGAEALRR